MLPPTGQIRTVCVGGVRELDTASRVVTTGIYKTPVDGPVAATGVNLEGDDQADRTVHGGPHKAVYGFPAEHYPSWRASFPEVEFTEGAFGENLTTVGLLEEDLCIGDLYRCGSCELRVTQPRMPCFKLAIRLGEKTVLKHMLESGQTGFYFTIATEGVLRAGDAMEPIERPDRALPVSEITRIYASRAADASDYRLIMDAPHMVEDWRSWAADRLRSIEGSA